MNCKISQIAFFYLLFFAHDVVPQDATTEASKETSDTTTVTMTISETTSAASTNATEKPSSTNLSKPYGSACSKNEDCDVTIGLTCNKGECDCARPKEMIYDKATNSCTVLESFSCDKISEMKLDQFNCTKHATCGPKAKGENQPKVCTCTKGYSPDDKRQCKGDFETTCDNEDEQCNDFAMLMCHIAGGETIGKCGCYTPKENVYENGKCVALAGGACTHNTPPYILACTPNATCIMENNALTKNTTGTCQCNKGTVQIASKRCAAKGSVSRFASNDVLITLMVSIVALIFKADVK